MTNAEMVSLKEYVERRMEDLHALIDERFAGHDRVLELASNAIEHRLAHLNALREAVNEQERRYALKEAVDLRLDRIDIDIRALFKSRDEIAGKASANSVLIGYVLWLMSMALTLAHMLFGLGVGK